jgi:hypothetical protein
MGEDLPVRSLSIWRGTSALNYYLFNSGLFWQKEGIWIKAGCMKSRITDYFFWNNLLSRFSDENGLIKSQKNDLNRPFWLAKLLFYGPRYRERKKRAILWVLVFWDQCRRYILVVVKSPHSGFRLVKRGDLDQGWSHGNANYRSLFLK